jgi:hypothetical protein
MLNTWSLPQLTYADEMWMRRIVDEDAKRLEQIQAAWDAYYGRNQETLKPAKADKGRTSPDNVVINYAQLVVDTGVYFLFGDDLHFEMDGNDNANERTPDEQYLDAVWEANRKIALLQKLAINGSVAGHAWLKIIPPRPGEMYPRLINLSPEYVHVMTDPHDIDVVVRYIVQYPAIDPYNGDRLVVRQVIERDPGGLTWLVRDQESRNDQQFRTLAESVWPWPWSPMVDCQNLPVSNEYYGRSDIEAHVLGLQRSVNFVASNMQRIIKYHAHPKTWGQGFRGDELKIAVDETIVLPGDASLQNLEMQSDLGSSLEMFARLKEALHQVTQTPEVATGKVDSIGNLSGLALKLLYGPLLSKTQVKRAQYGVMLSELHRRLLDMAGRDASQKTVWHWADALPSDPLAERQVALLDKQLGVSSDTLLQRLGFDPQAEREKRESDMTDMADTMLTAFDRGEQGASARRDDERD